MLFKNPQLTAMALHLANKKNHAKHIEPLEVKPEEVKPIPLTEEVEVVETEVVVPDKE